MCGELTLVRPAGEADIDLLVAWHADPEVARYWDDETFTADELRGRLERDNVDSFIVEVEGEPVGYLQAWRSGAAGGLDGFLVPGARGRGLMPDAAHALALALIAGGWPEVTVDPYTWNASAIRAWTKAGFVAQSCHPPDGEHSAEWVLMRFETPEPCSPTANQVRA